ncbi:MAG: prephenate dehydrogenase/arogenate dehydrogenase family protein [Desulfarculaceae bacterium]|nr:prephenate dehydrogenase/arogenate dehydrogenase family protein [Desulfarculaceae bacterium]MCF8071661.1 prephenate dehydrogenase/arogenate dehydrogenase family protein [Desulfarculaceae bacterium]MCF8102492.1 prephenate dehydrogenase/arogenate dehydrogenase family protein [Desulfarculaceae bacterium]MCF8114940.1 prephenate dehydrogenase/arogenate dehydrogenase family protein [Desulfarculaceae bacterium]
MNQEADFGGFTPPRPGEAQGLTVGIIGGQGRMGAWLQALLEPAVGRVLVADAKGDPVTPEFVRACQMIILAVPVHAVDEVMRSIGPHTDPEGVVVDITSLKQQPLASMLAHARGEVVGAHPLFGPGAPSLAGQIVFLTEGRGRRWLAWLRRFLRQQGARAVVMAPERHDRLMAQVQTLRHLMLYAFGWSLMQLGFHPKDDGELSGPWFQELLGLLCRQSGQPAELYADLALHNPDGLNAARTLQKGLDGLVAALEGSDRGALVKTMEEVGEFIKGGRPAICA